MRKLSSFLIAAAMIMAGMAAFTGSTATAAPGCGPYPGCIQTNTDTRSKNSPRAGNRIRLSVAVSTQGNGRPQGRLFFVFRKNGDVKKTATRWYSRNGAVRKVYSLGALPKGRYNVSTTFNARPQNSVYADSVDHHTLVRVRPRR